VLDSIVKNVGTPYTVYFGRNLYNTFMNAYTLVDGNVRKKLDETLKTWREPVPGSLSTTPVFRLDITQRIVDALSKARLAAQQSRSQHRVPVDPRMAITQTQPFRSTPTPPQTFLNYRGPSHTTQIQPPSRNGFTAPYTDPHVRTVFAFTFKELTRSPDFSASAATVSYSGSTRANIPESSVYCFSSKLCGSWNSLP
jgi:pre-mRNA cleavage complex 2 protein Pcf11